MLIRTLTVLFLLLAVCPSVSANPGHDEKKDIAACKSADGPGPDLTRAIQTALGAQLIVLSELTPTSAGETEALDLLAGRFERIALRSIEARSAWLAAASCGGSPAGAQITLEQMAEALREVRAARKALSEKGSPFGPKARARVGPALDRLDGDLNVALMDDGTGGGGNTCFYDLRIMKCSGSCESDGESCKKRGDIFACECKKSDPCP